MTMRPEQTPEPIRCQCAAGLLASPPSEEQIERAAKALYECERIAAALGAQWPEWEDLGDLEAGLRRERAQAAFVAAGDFAPAPSKPKGWSTGDRRNALAEAALRWGERAGDPSTADYAAGAVTGFALGAEWQKSRTFALRQQSDFVFGSACAWCDPDHRGDDYSEAANKLLDAFPALAAAPATDSEQREKLIAEAREDHVIDENRSPRYCRTCATPWPCASWQVCDALDAALVAVPVADEAKLAEAMRAAYDAEPPWSPMHYADISARVACEWLRGEHASSCRYRCSQCSTPLPSLASPAAGKLSFEWADRLGIDRESIVCPACYVRLRDAWHVDQERGFVQRRLIHEAEYTVAGARVTKAQLLDLVSRMREALAAVHVLPECPCASTCNHVDCRCNAAHECTVYECTKVARARWHCCEDHIPDDMGGQST